MNVNLSSLGVILALLVLVLALVFLVLGQLEPVHTGLIATLALARLL